MSFMLKYDDYFKIGNLGKNTVLGAMTVEDVYGTPLGCVVVGKISEGSLKSGDNLVVIHEDGNKTEANIMAIETGINTKCDAVFMGQRASLQLKDVPKSSVLPGAVLIKFAEEQIPANAEVDRI